MRPWRRKEIDIPPAWCDNLAKLDRRATAEIFKECEILSIDNVAEYYWSGTDKEEWDVMQDFPNLAPPFHNFWMEYQFPTSIRNSKGVEYRPHDQRSCEAIGLRVKAIRLRDEPSMSGLSAGERSARGLYAVYHGYHGYVESLKQKARALRLPYNSREFRECLGDTEERHLLDVLLQAEAYLSNQDDNHIEWLINITLYIEFRRHEIVGPCVVVQVAIDQKGNAKMEPAFGAWSNASLADRLADSQFKDAVTANWYFIYPGLLALSFLHCKNVTLATNTPPAKLSRAHEKRRGHSLMTFKTLEIEPMKKVLRHEGRSETTGLKKALHICRGHFKDYSKHGLFGKYKGLYWWESHVRGSVDEGVVVKDYNVKAKP
jgi:hypothetical protein